MSEVKNAVIIGKVVLPPKRSPVVKKVTPKPQEPRPARRERPQDPRTQNGQMLQELQYVKTQLRRVQEDLNRVVTQTVLREADYKELVGFLVVDLYATHGPEQVARIEELKRALGL
jgi:hypothetical protein